MPLEIERSSASRRDLFEIWDYVSPESRTGAERLLRHIDEVVQALARQPAMGRRRDELGSGVRSFPMENYMVYYRFSETRLTVIRILHAARDVNPEML